MKLPKFCDSRQAVQLVQALGQEFAVVHNPSYIHPPYEVYPLAPKAVVPLPRLTAVVCDMDGTTTTTEPLCLHSLEYMTRKMTGRMEPAQWMGLTDQDYPHVIGNSTTRHVEYLTQKYGSWIQSSSYLTSLVEACAWTLRWGKDRNRREESATTAIQAGLHSIVNEVKSSPILTDPLESIDIINQLTRKAVQPKLNAFILPYDSKLVRGAIEIYYACYHQILEQIARGVKPNQNMRLPHGTGGHMIEPMAGVAFFLATLKGWLELEQAGAIFDAMAADSKFEPFIDQAAGSDCRRRFLAAVKQFRQHPARVAIVTSSIRYEAQIVLGELFALLRKEVESWPLDKTDTDRLCEGFSSPETLYDALVTASDSSEIRLKPHRDLYSIALHRLGLSPSEFRYVLGLEDSESGLIALRAAGVSLSVAVPFAETQCHNLEAAMQINTGGLPQLMFENLFFLNV